MKRLFQSLGLFCVLVLTSLLPALAADSVNISGDSFIIAEENKTATFAGNVVIKQAGLTVWADTVVISYGAGGASDIQSLTAKGHVKIKTAEQTVTGDHGVYDPKARVMRVTGNVVTISASGTVTGPELLVNFATNTTEFVKREGGRVTGVFNQ
jgi:lipopolysaccharide export system protein LptA